MYEYFATLSSLHPFLLQGEPKTTKSRISSPTILYLDTYAFYVPLFISSPLTWCVEGGVGVVQMNDESRSSYIVLSVSLTSVTVVGGWREKSAK